MFFVTYVVVEHWSLASDVSVPEVSELVLREESTGGFAEVSDEVEATVVEVSVLQSPIKAVTVRNWAQVCEMAASAAIGQGWLFGIREVDVMHCPLETEIGLVTRFVVVGRLVLDATLLLAVELREM